MDKITFHFSHGHGRASAAQQSPHTSTAGTGSITAGGVGPFAWNGNLTMSGTTLSLPATSTTIAAGKLLTVSGGGTLLEANKANVSGAGSVVITGVGSSMQHVGGSSVGFNSGTGAGTVNATGSIALAAGTFNSNGNLTLDGGLMVRGTGSVLALAAGSTLTIQNDGDFLNSTTYSHTSASTMTVTGDDTIGKSFKNNASGQLCAEAGKALCLTGAVVANAGTYSLEGGTLDFAGAITNSAKGTITGIGALLLSALGLPGLRRRTRAVRTI